MKFFLILIVFFLSTTSHSKVDEVSHWTCQQNGGYVSYNADPAKRLCKDGLYADLNIVSELTTLECNRANGSVYRSQEYGFIECRNGLYAFSPLTHVTKNDCLHRKGRVVITRSTSKCVGGYYDDLSIID